MLSDSHRQKHKNDAKIKPNFWSIYLIRLLVAAQHEILFRWTTATLDFDLQLIPTMQIKAEPSLKKYLLNRACRKLKNEVCIRPKGMPIDSFQRQIAVFTYNIGWYVIRVQTLYSLAWVKITVVGVKRLQKQHSCQNAILFQVRFHNEFERPDFQLHCENPYEYNWDEL